MTQVKLLFASFLCTLSFAHLVEATPCPTWEEWIALGHSVMSIDCVSGDGPQTIPMSIGNLTNLVELYLPVTNGTTWVKGVIPSTIGELTNLEHM
jgi:hypothetical protein